ncbi:MAG: glutamine cyclotransferase [Myxococcales bacterium FL481]|nr:MAG: glutamine cyclotransferase [Myxococcales bacterium FL481]
MASGVAVAGGRVWVGGGDRLVGVDLQSGRTVDSIPVAADAGTASDGRYLYQLAGKRIQKVDPQTGEVVGAIPAPGEGKDSGMAWAEGCLWVGQFRDRVIVQIDAETGEVLKRIASDRFVTGVCWQEQSLWHGTLEEDSSELRRIDAETGEVLERYAMPTGSIITGLAADGDEFLCGGGSSGAVRRVVPTRRATPNKR